MRQDVERLELVEGGYSQMMKIENKRISWRSQDKGNNVHAFSKEEERLWLKEIGGGTEWRIRREVMNRRGTVAYYIWRSDLTGKRSQNHQRHRIKPYARFD